LTIRMSAATPIDTRHDFEALGHRARARDPQFATDFVNAVLRAARDAGASDVHLDPAADELSVRWRLDGVLQPLCTVPKEVGPNIIARLKVLAGLLTYEMSLPQEGRIWDEALRVEVRVSTFPTLFGERAVLRLLGASNSALDGLSQLGLPAAVLEELERHLAATSGAILIVGPAGSGKTTTAYACLRHVVAHSGGGRSIASLEDPVEVAVEGVAQSQVNLATEFDMATGLRSLLRLDPEVILIGEMRDRATAEIALQAALTGQLVVTTFHAGNCGDAVKRLVEIGIPAYAVRNAVRLVVAQRLVRRLCSCAQPGDVEKNAHALGIHVERCRIAGACELCRTTGYRGRALVAEWRTIGGGDVDTSAAGDEQLWNSAAALVEAGITSPQEVVRVLGLRRAT
jgi:type II secretory ATPase GspE/PulE/Tfp pilus assembly ATPase PilB-like protein